MRALLCAFLLVWSGQSIAQETDASSDKAAPADNIAGPKAPAVQPKANATAVQPKAKPASTPEATPTNKASAAAPRKAKAASVKPKVKKKAAGLVLYKKGRLKVTAHVKGTLRAEHVEPIVVDATGSERQLDTVFDALARGGITVDYRKNRFENLKLEYEHDGWTGPITEADQSEADLVLAPNAQLGEHELRKLSIKGRKDLLFGGAGLMLSHWGMGLIANDGAHGWKPGSGRFIDPRSGDRVLRGFAGLGPFPGIGLTILGGYDHMIKDDVLLEDDEGHQGIVALLIDPRKANRGGIYGAFRTHEHADGKKTEVTAIDVHVRLERKLGRALSVIAETESAYITGTSELGPTPDFPIHDVRQFGNASRLTLKGKKAGLALDFLFASGDQNYDDDQLNGFKADKNFDMGLILFRHLMASTSARTPILASDPDLLGYPSKDLDRIPTRGGATNTRSFFPRAWWNPIPGVEIYGGVLMALAHVKQANPFYSRLAGGQARNHLDGEPGQYLGTEYDAGIRMFFKRRMLNVRFAIEGAHFVPGDAFTDATGDAAKPITAMRSIFEVQI